MNYRISHDPDCSMPFEGDESVRLVVLHGRYSDPSRGACGRSPAAVEAWVEADSADEWFVLPLWLYDHGSTVYACGDRNPFHCPWDSGRVGIVALRRADWGRDGSIDNVMAERAADICRTYTQWANGDCWGFETDDGDSCWGFIGREAAEEAAREAIGATVGE